MATQYMTFNISQVIQTHDADGTPLYDIYYLTSDTTHNPDGTHYMTLNISQVIQTHNPDGNPLYDI